MFNTKSTSKIKKAKKIFYFKSKLNHVIVIALSDWQLLLQVSENTIPPQIMYSYSESISVFTSKSRLTKNQEYQQSHFY